jgi:quinol monooxygenase YgiN
MPLRTFVRFEPQLGKEQRLREELQTVGQASRSEAGYLSIHLFESLPPPVVFFSTARASAFAPVA